jgi:hypothetical protein
VTISRAYINLDFDLHFPGHWFQEISLDISLLTFQGSFNCGPGIFKASEMSINPVHCQKP